MGEWLRYCCFVLKDALNHFLVHSNAKKDSFRSAKNVVFSLFAFWSTGQWGRGATEKKQSLWPYKAIFTLDCAFEVFYNSEKIILP